MGTARLFTDHFRLFGLKQGEISLRHSLSRIKKINVESSVEETGGERGERVESVTVKRCVFKKRQLYSDTWSGDAADVSNSRA